ncbi:hypothetical protein HUT18_21520 [Streptomyces sp. NA04227]|uniref:hypothetical protein n=1 Tax=Streptomyces sp. NA04227 TaxID=2742136 RepID=UPI001591C40E|nr:hypothetical protein [Streptomyces sp. NA04227]QKW08561.1 hypothetical protein HUT18_21520 [Streptomyces sp. NA04227]
MARALGACALGACAFLVGPATPALSADQTEPSCAGLPAGEYANPNDAHSFYACGPLRPAEETPCELDQQGQRLYYVDGSGPDPTTSRCDRAAAAPSDHTPTLTAGQARATTMYPYVIHGLTATAEREDGSPLFGAEITFTAADGTHLCTAYTDRNGRALCDSEPVSVNAQTLRLGYEAAYPGTEDGTWNPAHAQGGITVPK